MTPRCHGRRILAGLFPITCILSFSISVLAAPSRDVPELAEPEGEVDAVGDVDGKRPQLQKVLQDTVWIAAWSFDTGAPCSAVGWTHVDNRVLNDGVLHWHLESLYNGQGGIVGQAAAVGIHDAPLCVSTDGYANDWYQAIRLTYTGAAALSFDYLLDSEPTYDFLQVETDSLCLSFARVDYQLDASRNAATFRNVELQAEDLILDGSVADLVLTSYGPGTHCAYIAFHSDATGSPCDGGHAPTLGEGLVVDNLQITDAGGTRNEDFEDGQLNLGTYSNLQDSEPFGTWARLYPHASDNDLCTENTTCAWLWTDHKTPSIANDPSMAFGPGSFVVRNWLDDIIVGPWVSLASTPAATGTVLHFRRFPGNDYNTGRIVQNWSVRSRRLVNGTWQVSNWGHAYNWNSLSVFRWLSSAFDMSPYFDAGATEVQIRFRTSDWQWIADEAPPAPFVPGPGPYLDDIRIGRRVLQGPVISEGIDARSQAQDGFPTEIHPGVDPAMGEHFRPTTSIFGTCALSEGTDLCSRNWCANLVTGDSIWVQVRGVRPGGETVTAVTWQGAIVRGPHQGKAPPPYAPGANGFFSFAADSVRHVSGSVIQDFYCVDLDDTYFRGGDMLVYFWAATDNGGGFSSDPAGLTAIPASIDAAEAATGGLLEVSFLPTIDWAPAYVARIQADAHGDLEPTEGEIAASTQSNCILYVQFVNSRRRSGDVNRTSFMYALDRLGYRDHYDVYDHTGMGATNNHLGGRATVAQAQGYSLIVWDAGTSVSWFVMPPSFASKAGGSPGLAQSDRMVDQVTWFQDWLAQAVLGAAGRATLWILGSNAADVLPLYTNEMGIVLDTQEQSIDNPDLTGVMAYAFDAGDATIGVDFRTDLFSLYGGCLRARTYDGLGASGTAVVTHRYRDPMDASPGEGAMVMNSSPALNWNTIFTAFPWSDLRDPGRVPASPQPEAVLLRNILGAVLPSACVQDPTPTSVGGGVEANALPRVSALHANTPNPFNPATRIGFDLAQDGRVTLRVYDVGGRVVRTLVDGDMRAGRDLGVVWNGADDAGTPVASGIYVCRLDAPGLRASRKLVLLR